MSNKGWYMFWKVMTFVSLGYLIFAIIPPTVLKGIYIGGISLATALVFLWISNKRIKNDGKPRG